MADQSPIGPFTTAVVVLTACGAFFAGPVFAYADLGTVATFGFGLGVSAAGAWLSMQLNWGRRWEYPALFAGLVCMVGLHWQFTVGLNNYGSNRARCSNLQAEMLKAAPRRGDLSDLFQAFQCQPRGGGLVQYPATSAAPSAGGGLE